MLQPTNLMQPAIVGGTPARNTFLPLAVPLIGDEEKQEVLDALDSGWITKGPKTHQFEEDFKTYVGSRHAIAVSSCTAGLHVALVAANIGEGDEVITCPMTFVATANVILHQHATPVFVDCDSTTYNIIPALIEAKITSRTKAIIPIHMHGLPCDLDEIMAIAKRHGLLVIEDAAHAVGAEYHSRKIGSLGDVTAFSFYATKNLTTGDGGMVTTDNDELAEKMRIWSLHGMSTDAWRRYSADGKPQANWQAIYPGFKYNLTDIQSAIGLHQLRKLDDFIATRERYSQIYDEGLGDMPEVVTPVKGNDIKHGHHLYVIALRLEHLSINRDQFMTALRAENIGTGLHFMSVHLQPYYQEKFGYHAADYPNATYLSERIISLPLCPRMCEGDVRDVIAAIKKIVNYYRH